MEVSLVEEVEKLQYQDELKANRFSSIFLSIMCGVCILVWIANECGLFVVNRTFMRIGMIIACVCLIIPVATYLKTKGKNAWFKYVLIICVSLMAISIQTFLTFHGVLLCLVPIILAAQYPQTKVFKLAFIMNLIGVFVAVLAGYYIGCWDGNMIYATTYGVTVETDSLASRAEIMNGNYTMQLLLYFALPRMIIFSTISLSAFYILKNAKLQYVRQNVIKIQAETDGLTGLENRAKYNYRIQNEYLKLNSVFVAFIDVNYLKKMNDTCGHEAGDSVLKRVANEMKKLIGEDVHGYRLGGDEFALIFCNYSSNRANIILNEWEKDIEPINRKEDPVQCSLAIGKAFSGNPVDIEAVLKEADRNMYEVKKAMKAERRD